MGDVRDLRVTSKAALIATLKVAIKSVERGDYNDAYREIGKAQSLCEGVDDGND